jgi:hypothetical protein
MVFLFMQLCLLIPRRAVATLMVLGFVQWATLNAVAFPSILAFPSAGRFLRPYLQLTNYLADWSSLLLPVELNRSQYDDLSGAVHVTADLDERYNVVAVEYPWLNADSADFFSAKERLRTGIRGRYMSLGYTQSDPTAAMNRIEVSRARYVITVSEQHQVTPDFVNLVSLPVLKLMRQDSRFSEYPFQSKNGLVVFKFAPAFQAAHP